MLRMPRSIALILSLGVSAIARAQGVISFNVQASAPTAPQPVGQTIPMNIGYQWNNANGGLHSVSIVLGIPSNLELISASVPAASGSTSSMFQYQSTFTTNIPAPFSTGQPQNVSGNGSFTINVRSRAGSAPGTQQCVTVAGGVDGRSFPQQPVCITVGAAAPAVPPHWTLTQTLSDGTGSTEPNALFRVDLADPSATTSGEPSLVGASIGLSLVATSGTSAAKIVAVTQGPALSSGMPSGWSVVGNLPGTSVAVAMQAPLSPLAPPTSFYVHVSLTGNATGSTTMLKSTLNAGLSNNPTGGLTLNGSNEIRVVAIPK